MSLGTPFEWMTAVRFLREGRMQSVFIVSGVAIGVGVIVFMSALLGGLQANLFHRIMSSQPHITIDRPRQRATPQRGPAAGELVIAAVQLPSQRMNSIDQWQKVRDQLQRRQDIAAVSPTVSGPAFVIRGDATQSIQLIGIEPEPYARIVPLPEKMVAGSWQMTNTDLLVGTDFATEMGVEVGDKLRLANLSGARLTLNVCGLFDLGSRGANKRTAYVLLTTAQNLLDLTGGVSGIDLTAIDPYAAEQVARSITAQTGLEAISWIAANSQFFASLKAQEFSSLLIRLFVGLSVAAGIASVLVVSVGRAARFGRRFAVRGRPAAGVDGVGEEPRRHADVRDPARSEPVPVDGGAGDADRGAGGGDPGDPGRAPRSRGGDAWLSPSCASPASARATGSAPRSRSKSCTASTCSSSPVSSWP